MSVHLSGTVRFSIESLLYYAPKITGTGDALATAVDRVQRRLLDLGDFFGMSASEEPFRNNYPRCQYAMLIMARDIANEIQGIGGGIERMARTYGVAEDRNTADIRQIQVNEGQTATRISHTGGLPSPPSVAPGRTVPARSANPFERPHPQVGPAPDAPHASATPTAVNPESYITLRSHAPGPTPSPQPGLDPAVWKQRDSRSLFGPWPTGEPNKMEEAAICWTALNEALDAAWTDLQRYTAYILADAQGPAADTFQDYVDKLTARGHGALYQAIDLTQELHNACMKQAAEVRELRHVIEQAAVEFVATFVVSQAVAIFTFGTAEEVNAAVEAGLTVKLTSWAERIAKDSELAAEVLNSMALNISKILAAAFTSSTQSIMIGEADLLTTNIINQAFGTSPAGGIASLKTAVESGAVGAILGQGSAGGLLGLSAAAASKKLLQVGEAITASQGREDVVGAGLTTLGVQLKDSSITVAAANAAATQLLTEHKVTPVTLITGTISNRFTDAISPPAGKHAR